MKQILGLRRGALLFAAGLLALTSWLGTLPFARPLYAAGSSNITIVSGATNTRMTRTVDVSDVTYAPNANSAQIGAANLAADLNNGFNVTIVTTTGTGSQQGDIIMNAGVSISWAGAALFSIIADRKILLNSGASINSSAGDIALWANSEDTGTGVFTAIVLDNAAITTVTGAVALEGYGGNASGSRGVLITNGSTIAATGMGEADIAIFGSVVSGGPDRAVEVTGTGTQIRSAGSAIQLSGDSAGDEAVYIGGGAKVIATGSAMIGISGVNYNEATTSYHGVMIEGAGTQITAVDGDIEINGEGEDGKGLLLTSSATVATTGVGQLLLDGYSAFNDGIVIEENAQATTGEGDIAIVVIEAGKVGVKLATGAKVISANGNIAVDSEVSSNSQAILLTDANTEVAVTAGAGIIDLIGFSASGNGIEIARNVTSVSGDITLVGTATSGAADGVVVANTGRIASSSGAIQLTGAAAGGDGIEVSGAIGDAATTGAITLVADTINVVNNSATIIQSAGPLTIKPRLATTTIGLGGGAGLLNLNDVALSRIVDGFSTISIGDGANGTGAVELDSVTVLDPVLIAGGTIQDKIGTDISAPSVALAGTIAPGQSPGILMVNGNFIFAANSTFAAEIGGTTPGEAANNHDQINVAGTVAIGSNVVLSLAAVNGYTAAAGDTLVLINNDGTEAVSGTFHALAEGAIIPFGGKNFQLSYAGGSGNDVVLRESVAIVPTPTATTTPTPTTTATGTITVLPTPTPTATATGTITVLPTFTPGATATPQATVAPDATATVQPDRATTLAFAGTAGDSITVVVPAGAVTATITLAYTALDQPLGTPPASFQFANRIFALDALRESVLIKNFTFQQPVTITIDYRADDVAGLNEPNLGVYYFDEATAQWRSDGIAVVDRDRVSGRITFTVTHLTVFALFGTATPAVPLYLPLINNP